MSTSEPMIELGDDWTVAEQSPRSGAATRRFLRPAAIGMVLALSLGLLVRSERPLEPELSRVGIVPLIYAMTDGNDIQLVGDLLITNFPGGITAYGLDGKQRWQYRARDMSMLSPVHVVGLYQLLLVRRSRPPVIDEEGRFRFVSDVVALDPSTGEPKWHLDFDVTPIGELRVGQDEQRGLRVYGGSPPALLWQSGPLRGSFIDLARQSLFGLTHSDVLVEFDPATGKRLRQRGVAGPPGDGAVTVRTVGDRIFLDPLDAPFGSDPWVYDRRTLAPVNWDLTWWVVSACGPVTCVQSTEGEFRMGAADSATGELLWSVANQYFVPTAAGLLTVSMRDGLLVNAIALVEPKTGKVRRALDGWRISSRNEQEIQILTKPGPQRSQVAVVDEGGFRVVGAVPYEFGECRQDGRALICEIDHGHLGVWRVNPRPFVARR